MDRVKESESFQFESYKKIFCENLTRFFNKSAFVDVTLICNEEPITAHQVVLCTCSQFFENILSVRSDPHPIIVFTDIQKKDMVPLLQFMYTGHVNFAKNDLPSLLRTAEKLQIRGLNYKEFSNGQTSSEEVQVISTTKNLSPVSPTRLRNTVQFPEVSTVDQGSVKAEPKWLTSSNNSNRPKERREKKVINPFARTSKTISDSDSTVFEDDLSLPGPSKKKCTRPIISPPEQSGSDVEFIDHQPTVMVINDTQVSETSDSEIKTHSRVKKQPEKLKRRRIIEDSDLVAVKNRKMDVSSDEDFDLQLRTKTKRNQSTPKTKREIEWTSEMIEEPFEGFLDGSWDNLVSYCIVCKKKKKNLWRHIQELHSVPPRGKQFFCPKCSIRFSRKISLKFHKC